jgi:lipopolysaccharide export LptBFGC system permease protein LptF
MKFGVKADKDTDTGGSGGERYIKYFGEDGAYTLRFLQPWKEWTAYWEHFSMKFRCSYPCLANEEEGIPRSECPGCQLETSDDESDQREARANKKFLVNAIRTDDKRSEGYVDLWKIPGSLKDDLVFNSERDKGLSKREYIVIRREKNNRTSYSLDKEDPAPIDLSIYADKLHDHNEALTKAWEYRWDDKKRAEEQARRAEAKKASEDKKAPVVHAEGDTEEPPFEPKGFKKGGLSIVPEPEKDEDEQINVTVSSIRQMSAEQLRKLYAQGGFDAPDTDDQAELAEKLISALSS